MNILLCCSAGMSTSLLVTKMEKYVAEQGINATIWAVGSTEIRNEIEKADVLLLGPQVRYMLNDMKKACEGKRIPVDVINPIHYGMCNGEEVVKQAVKLIEG